MRRGSFPDGTGGGSPTRAEWPTNHVNSVVIVVYVCIVGICFVGVLTPGVPGPTSELSPRAPAQMGRRETEHEGVEEREEKGKACGLRVCPAPRSGALAVGGYKRPRGGRARDSTHRPVLPRDQPSRKRALDLPFIGVRRGSRCTMGGVAVR
jgi:hypothetical protein